MKIENTTAPVARNGLAASGSFRLARNKIELPTIRGTRIEAPHATFTSGARNQERKVARASAAACSGTPGGRSSRNRVRAFTRAEAGVGEGVDGAVTFVLPPDSPR